MGKSSGSRALKLLAFLVILVGATGFDLRHQCLAQTATTSFSFSLEDLGPFRGRGSASRPEFRLFQTNGVWDLELKAQPTSRVTALALEDFRSARYRTGGLNPMLMVDWLFDFDPMRIVESRAAKFIQPRRPDTSEFLRAWNAYLQRLQEEFTALKAELKRQGYTTTAELYFSKAVVQEGIVTALQDPAVRARLQKMAGDVLSEKLASLEFKLDESFDAQFQSQTYRTQLLGLLLIKPQLRVEDFEVTFEPSSGRSDPYRQPLGKLSFILPMSETQIEVKSFEIRSEFTQQPYIIGEQDQMSMRVEFNQAKPFRLTAEIVWDKLLQRPDIRFNEDDIEAPFKSAKLTKIQLRGESYEPSQGSVVEWMMNKEGWRLLQNTVEGGGFVQNLVALSTNQLTQLLQKNLPFRETFVVIDKVAPNLQERFDLQVFTPGLAMHDPGLNPNLIARFQLTIPIEIRTPEMNLNVRPTEEALAGQVSIQIVNPDVELEHLELFWKGRRLSNERMGFRLRMMNRAGQHTRLDAQMDLSLNKALEFRLDQLQTNLEGLAIQALEVRLGDRWLKGNRPSLAMIVENIATIRRELLNTQGQRGLGGRIQALVENQLRTELTTRLRNLAIDTPPKREEGIVGPERLETEQQISWYTNALGGLGIIENAKIGLKGRINIPHIPLQESSFRMRDYRNHSPVCKGTYLISAETKVAMSGAIPVVGEGWDIKVDWHGYQSQILVQTVTGSLVSVGETRFQFTVDVCLSANQEQIDIQIREARPLFGQMAITNIQAMGVQSTSASIERLASVVGWESGIARDVAISRLIEGMLKGQTLEFERLQRKAEGIILTEISNLLNSARVRGQLERALINVGDYEEKAIELMMDLGKSLKAPLEAMIAKNLTRIVGEHLPQVEGMINKARSTMDDLIVNIGALAGADLEAAFQSQMMQFIHGAHSLAFIHSEFKRVSTPSKALQVLKQRFGFMESPFEVAANLRRNIQLLAALPSCPFREPEADIQKWREGLYAARLEPKVEAQLDALIIQSCTGENGEESSLVDSVFKEGFLSANQVLMSEGVRSYLKLPTSENVPLAANRDFEIPVEISKVELVPTANDDIFRVTISSSAFSNGLDVLAPRTLDPVVLGTLQADAQNLIFRLPRTIINQALLKVDWADLLRVNFPTVFGPYDQIVVERAPFLTENEEISFKIYVRSRSGKIRLLVTPIIKLLASLFDEKASDENLNRLVERKDQEQDMPGVNFNDVTAFALSFLDLRNMFGFEADIDAAMKIRLTYTNRQVQVGFDPMRIEEVDAGYFRTPIQRRLEAAHRPLNRLIGEMLSQIGEIPSLEVFASRLSLAEARLVNGDFYAVIRRDDESPIDREFESR